MNNYHVGYVTEDETGEIHHITGEPTDALMTLVVLLARTYGQDAAYALAPALAGQLPALMSGRCVQVVSSDGRIWAVEPTDCPGPEPTDFDLWETEISA